MIKKILFTLIAVLLFGFSGFTACGKEEKSTGQFYTLQEAYDNELLTVEKYAKYCISIEQLNIACR